jgi:hypothetical protein
LIAQAGFIQFSAGEQNKYSQLSQPKVMTWSATRRKTPEGFSLESVTPDTTQVAPGSGLPGAVLALSFSTLPIIRVYTTAPTANYQYPRIHLIDTLADQISHRVETETPALIDVAVKAVTAIVEKPSDIASPAINQKRTAVQNLFSLAKINAGNAIAAITNVLPEMDFLGMEIEDYLSLAVMVRVEAGTENSPGPVRNIKALKDLLARATALAKANAKGGEVAKSDKEHATNVCP